MFGCPRNSIWVDVVSNQISCGPEVVAKVAITNGILHVAYGEGWDSWDVFINDADLKNLIIKAEGKLSKAAERKGKGKEK